MRAGADPQDRKVSGDSRRRRCKLCIKSLALTLGGHGFPAFTLGRRQRLTQAVSAIRNASGAEPMYRRMEVSLRSAGVVGLLPLTGVQSLSLGRTHEAGAR